ncbi:esterase-like activity of phytase family protein [Mesorhizobium sp. Z1-4]|uniref:esterase-like activity of phytase family protein n=1 Tax=Mesorhizobium sp. Z1-4 TaxID=2448478 RepID=UPI001FDFA0A7|nr:esterase-like activity of phytase family protein [Mesorhizobium sp. Z1-4]
MLVKRRAKRASRITRYAFAVFAAFAALSTAPAAAQSPLLQEIEVNAHQITQFHIGRSETRFGPLEFVGGLSMAGSGDFGALSAIRFLDAGTHFFGVADTGFWYSGMVERDADLRPTGITGFSMQPLVDETGAAIEGKWRTDAEGLAIAGDQATVAFERDHKIQEFTLQPSDMAGPRRALDLVVSRAELRQNRGFETLVHSPADGPLGGARVGVTERSIDADGNIFAAILEGPQKGIFKVVRSDDFDITDGAFLPNGDLLLLERRFSMATGVAMRLRRIDGATIRKGALVDGAVLLEADMAYQIDNMEGLDVWRRDDGALIVSLISDDNHSILQRNLYLEFVLTGE